MNHKWSDPIPVLEGPNGCEQTERTCVHCSLVKITVHPPRGYPWREWRHPQSAAQFPAEHTPPCIAGGTSEVRPA